MKLNKTHFEFFKKRCKFWVEYWGLKNWDIRYKFDKTEKEECAVTQSQLVDRLAWITLDNDADWDGLIRKVSG